MTKIYGPKWGGWKEQRGGAAVGLRKIQTGKNMDTGEGGNDMAIQQVCTPAPQNVCTAITLISCPKQIRRAGNVSPAPCLRSSDNSVHGSIRDSELLGFVFVCLFSCLVFAIWSRMASNSQFSFLIFPSVGVAGVQHPAQLLQLFLFCFRCILFTYVECFACLYICPPCVCQCSWKSEK